MQVVLLHCVSHCLGCCASKEKKKERERGMEWKWVQSRHLPDVRHRLEHIRIRFVNDTTALI